VGISSPICSIELSFNIFSAFLNISSNFAASGSVAARAARKGPTFLDKDMFASPTLSLVNGSKENCPLLLKKRTKSDAPAAPRIGRASPFGDKLRRAIHRGAPIPTFRLGRNMETVNRENGVRHSHGKEWDEKTYDER
jgi:hypothetical protein